MSECLGVKSWRVQWIYSLTQSSWALCAISVLYSMWCGLRCSLCARIHVATRAVTRVLGGAAAAAGASPPPPCARVCANSGPPAHFTRTQTSKAVWINPACRAAPHAIRNFTSLLLQPHQTYTAIHIEMNRWSFAMHRITIPHSEEIKLQKSEMHRGVCRWRCWWSGRLLFLY